MTEKIKILLADDDLELVKIIRKKLSENPNYEFIEAHNGEEALTIILSEQPDLVVLDVMMPSLNGWEVCKYVRNKEELSDVAIVMLTAIGPNLNELTSPLYGADDYVDKPFNFTDLEQTIERVLKKRNKL